jgi:hypothetical protein
MENFEIHFKTSKKVVTVTLTEQDAVFELANLFKRLLDDAGIPCTISEMEVTTPSKEMQVVENDDTNPFN